MKAVVYESYGSPDVLGLHEVDRPVAGDSEVLVEVGATSVTTADWRLRAAAFPGVMQVPGRLMFGILRPRRRVLGGEFAGRVEAVGARVTRFRPGQRVFGFCGLGAHAEYVAVPEAGAIAPTPENLGDEQAAAVPFGALAALVFLRDQAGVQPGQRVLIVGASGGVGVYAVQLAQYLGAEVTGVCSTTNVELVRSLGAAHVIDYALEDFAGRGRVYDVILDTVGATGFKRCKDTLADGGVFVPLNFGLRELAQKVATLISGGKRIAIGVNDDTREDLEFLLPLLASGALRPVIDRRYPLDRIAEAHSYVEGRHRKGSVVIAV
jgi:NADPH:quinone reductase-like Zn-dependent oxidoreductase